MGTGSCGHSRMSGAVWGELLIAKVSVEEVKVSWKKFKRQYSVVAKSVFILAPGCLGLNPCLSPSLHLKFLIC